jgi:protein-L-isoaspartate(D-aspartate) O-methyltransferase
MPEQMNSRIAGIGMTSQRTRLRMVERLRAQGIRDEQVLNAMSEVPRHIFVDEALASRAYDDVSLPIGFGQTISNPFTVARMLELARGGKALNKTWRWTACATRLQCVPAGGGSRTPGRTSSI